MGHRVNGGVIGTYVNTTSTAAPGVWSMNAAAQRVARRNANIVDIWPDYQDASFASVVGLYHCDIVTSAGITLPDSSGSALDLSLAGTSTPRALQPTIAKFGPQAMYCNAMLASHATNAAYNFGTGDYCIEFWIYVASLASQQTIFDFRNNTEPSIRPDCYVNTDGSIHVYINGADRIVSSASAIVINTWYHYALARVSSNTRLFLAGTQLGSTYSDSATYTQGSVSFGGTWAGVSLTNCYFDEIRITKGVGRYSSNFTAPTAPFPDY